MGSQNDEIHDQNLLTCYEKEKPYTIITTLNNKSSFNQPKALSTKSAQILTPICTFLCLLVVGKKIWPDDFYRLLDMLIDGAIQQQTIKKN